MANFNSVPTIHAPRSRFDLSHSNKLSANVGTLYPFLVQEVYPGDVFDVDASVVARLTSAYIRPPMDDLYLDMYYFFVPNRIVDDTFQEVFGENTQSAWAQAAPVAVPTFQSTSSSDLNIVYEGSVADYLGLPYNEGGDAPMALPNGVTVLPFRGFAKIYDDWFRDQNLVAPMQIYTGTFSYAAEGLNNNAWAANNYTGMLPKVAKFHDYFTSALPGTQKGSAITLPITGLAPVVGSATAHDIGDNGLIFTSDALTGSGTPVSNYIALNNVTAAAPLGKAFTQTNNAAYDSTTVVNGTNLVADLSGATQATVNDLRYAFALQKILERSARSGSRYVEYLLAAFSVKSPDGRLQRSEYLGGKRIPLSTQQVAQTTRSSSSSDPETLASLGAFSLTNGKSGFSKGFVEHGFVFGVLCIRQRHTYQYGIEKFWMRSNRFDFYDPSLAFIGEQPIYRNEIYAYANTAGTAEVKDGAFGYQEAWADLRYRPNRVCGQMRSNSATSLDIWHFADTYSNAPTLNKQWIEETPDYVDRTLAVPSSSLDQFILDIYIRDIATRRLPTYSVPSLIDHY